METLSRSSSLIENSFFVRFFIDLVAKVVSATETSKLVNSFKKVSQKLLSSYNSLSYLYELSATKQFLAKAGETIYDSLQGSKVILILKKIKVGSLLINSVDSFQKRVDLFSPLVCFPLFYVAYVALGFLKITKLPQPPLSVLLYFALGLVAFLLGEIAYLKVSKIRVEEFWRMPSTKEQLQQTPERLNRLAAILLVIVGIIAVLAVIVVAGVPILKPAARIRTSPILGFLAQFMVIGSVLLVVYLSRSLSPRKQRFLLLTIFILNFLALGLLGYRTPLIFLGLFALVVYNYLIRKVSLLVLFSVFALLAIFGAIFGHYRLLMEWGGHYYVYLEHIGAPKTLIPLLPLYFFFRTGSSIFAEIANRVPFYGRYFSSVFLSTFSVILPGEQTSPRFMVTYLVGERRGSSTTPSIIGPYYMDFGIFGIVVGMFLMGYFLVLLYARLRHRQANANDTLLYSYVLTAFLLAIHTGLVDPNFYINLAVLLILLWASHFQKFRV